MRVLPVLAAACLALGGCGASPVDPENLRLPAQRYMGPPASCGGKVDGNLKGNKAMRNRLMRVTNACAQNGRKVTGLQAYARALTGKQ